MKLFLSLFLFSLISFSNHAIANNTTKELIVIKSTTNRDETNTGDYWIANDLSLAFKSFGYNTDTDYRTEYHRSHPKEPMLNIYMRGYTKFAPPFGKNTNMLYVYYPMAYDKNSITPKQKNKLNTRSIMPQNANLDDDFQNFDIITVASKSYTEELNKFGINAIYIPQFTNPEKFYPSFQEDLKTDILFVGSNWHDRTSLRYALELGYNVSVYGYNWHNIVPNNMYKKEYIPNEKLNQYYSSAKIVLNDHRPDMKEFGFINNRIYDATASGALVVSDYIKELDEIYQGSVPLYKTKEELDAILKYYLTHEKERQILAQKARQITLQNFTNTNIAKQILSNIKK